MESVSRPADEVRIDVPLVWRLIAAQFPQWAGLPVKPAGAGAAGTDNVIYRLGPDLAVRLPRRPFGADHLERAGFADPGLMSDEITLRPARENDVSRLENLTQDPEKAGELEWAAGPTCSAGGGAGPGTA